MYTLGTSAIAWIKTQITDTAILAALEGKLVGYVGTQADRIGDANFPATFISPYSVFFECAAAVDSPHVIAVPITSTTVYRPTPVDAVVPTTWTSIGTLTQTYVTNILLPAGAIKNGMYQFSRGTIADIDSVLRADGLPYYARDKKALYVWDSSKTEWVRVTYAALPVGSIITFHQKLAIPDIENYLRCDGAVATIVSLQELYDVIGKQFEDPEVPTDSTHFRLPLHSNGLIRIKE
jgi:hypothetical protein